MTLLLRKIQLAITCPFKRPIKDLGQKWEQEFRVLPIDLDEYFHMNNAKYLNYMELARWDFQLRSGFFKYALKNSVAGPIASIHITYKRQLKVFQKFKLVSTIAYWDESAVYILTEFKSKGKMIANGLCKVVLLNRKGKLPPTEVFDHLRLKYGIPVLPGYVDQSMLADKLIRVDQIGL